MISFVKTFIKGFFLFVKIDWIDTIRLNLFHLPFRQGRKFPVLLFDAKLNIRNNSKIQLRISDKECCFGMIKLGIRYSRNILQTTGFQIDLRSSGGIIFYGSGIMGCGSNIITRKEGIIEFGKNFRISGNFSVCSLSKIEIRNNLSCSWNVSIYDTDFHEIEDMETGIVLPMTRNIIIGDNCWLCQQATLLKGVRLPNWSIVGGCSLVNKDYTDYPLHTLFAGVPAKALKKKIVRRDLKTIVNVSDWKITSGLHLLNELPK